MFAGAERSRYEAWFVLYGDFIASGVKSPKTYAEALSKNDNITTALPKRQTEDILLAIKRCVKKYGTISKVQAEHAKWCKANGYAYADASNLKKFAPEGQRAKSAETTQERKRAEVRKALMKAGFSSHAAETAMNICGLK